MKNGKREPESSIAFESVLTVDVVVDVVASSGSSRGDDDDIMEEDSEGHLLSASLLNVTPESTVLGVTESYRSNDENRLVEDV